MAKSAQKAIYIFADWDGLDGPQWMGTLLAAPSRGKEIFSFQYAPEWLKSGNVSGLDPRLRLLPGPQYPHKDHANFGIFLDSSPDRWGRTLMARREAQRARAEGRPERRLLESDYLLGVFDGHRMGALRFKSDKDGPFLDDNSEFASPPWALLRDLEYASRQLEEAKAESNKDYMKWLRLLIAPGGSLGGARPKASVVDERGDLWIAKFPSKNDEFNVGAWEYVIHQLAVNAKIETADAQIKRFSGNYDTFLTRRFDRGRGKRIHFASAMTLLERTDGSAAEEGVSYLDFVDFLSQNGSQVDKDLEQLWRRIVFNICISNVDDHLRNHGFLLTAKGWKLSPAYDMNPSENGDGLKLNISATDNAQDLGLALEVAENFRLSKVKAANILGEVVGAVRLWRKVAHKTVSAKELSKMKNAFRVADAGLR
jgi:serine/threonine-protein kinase HipA